MRTAVRSMTKTSPIFFFLLMISLGVIGFSLVPSVHATYVGKKSSLDVQLVNYQPVPARPGDNLDVWLQVMNDGGTPSKKGTVTILESYPFIVESETDKTKDFDNIPAQSGFLVKTKVRVDKDANEGVNYVKVRVQEEGSDDWIERELPITIRGTSSALTILSTNVESEKTGTIPPGGEATLTIRIKNVGSTLIRNLEAKLDLKDLPFTPKEGSNAITRRTLAGGEETELSFKIAAYPDAESKAYQVPITLTYEDEQGNEKEQEEVIGLLVGAAPELLVYLEKNDIKKETLNGNVIIKFANKGLGKIKLLTMSVEENSDVKVVSDSPVLYVGDIDEDDYESAELSLQLTKPSVELPIKVEYRDSLNHKYSTVVTLKLNAKEGKKSGGSWLWIALLLLIAILIAWRWKKKA